MRVFLLRGVFPLPPCPQIVPGLQDLVVRQATLLFVRYYYVDDGILVEGQFSRTVGGAHGRFNHRRSIISVCWGSGDQAIRLSLLSAQNQISAEFGRAQ